MVRHQTKSQKFYTVAFRKFPEEPDHEEVVVFFDEEWFLSGGALRDMRNQVRFFDFSGCSKKAGYFYVAEHLSFAKFFEWNESVLNAPAYR